MRTKLDWNKMLIFGLSPQEFGLNIQTNLYQAFSLENCQLLFAEKLSEIAADQKKKAALWNCLKEMFPK